MNINDIDPTITNDEIISKADNIYMMLKTSIMLKDIKRVDHKIGDELYERFSREIENDRKNNEIHMFDELNVKTTRLVNAEIVDDKIIVKIELVSRYLNYYLNQDTREFIRGDKETRETHTNYMTLEKNVHAKEIKAVKYCPSCGHSMDTSYTGVCDYCGSIYNTEKYDYILTEIKSD